MDYQFPKIETSNTINQQIWKMREEMLEIEAEHSEIIVAQMMGEPYSFEDLAIETIDLMQACETLLRELPFSKREIDALHQKVIRKNRARGYYKEG